MREVRIRHSGQIAIGGKVDPPAWRQHTDSRRCAATRGASDCPADERCVADRLKGVIVDAWIARQELGCGASTSTPSMVSGWWGPLKTAVCIAA